MQGRGFYKFEGGGSGNFQDFKGAVDGGSVNFQDPWKVEHLWGLTPFQDIGG